MRHASRWLLTCGVLLRCAHPAATTSGGTRVTFVAAHGSPAGSFPTRTHGPTAAFDDGLDSQVERALAIRADDPGRDAALWRVVDALTAVAGAPVEARDDLRGSSQRAARRLQLIRALSLIADAPGPRADEAVQRLAATYQAHGDPSNARRTYVTLLQRFPASRFVPTAYVFFGDAAFEHGTMENARTFYERVLQIPAPGNTLAAYASYRLAWVHSNLQDYPRALASFVRAVQSGTQYPQPGSATLVRAARRDAVVAYAACGRPSAAPAFFLRIAADASEAVELLERLARQYEGAGQTAHAAQVYQDLVAAHPGDVRVGRWQQARGAPP